MVPERAKRLLVAGLTACALMTLASTADAMPMRWFNAFSEEGSAFVTAQAYSPPAGQCGANFRVDVHSEAGREATRRGRFNACREDIGGGWSYGYISATFWLSDIGRPYDEGRRYRICVTAWQPVSGQRSSHTICRHRWL